MITPDDELGFLLAASPVFAEVWGDRALGRAARARRGPWVLHAFAVHASYLIANRQLDLVPPVFDVVERLLVEGDEKVKDHVVCYFLEGVWIELKKRDRTIDNLFDHWILGQATESSGQRWSIIRDVLGWVE